MATYLFEASYTPDGVKGLVRDGGVHRREAVSKAAERLGGRVEAFYYAFGEVDAYVIASLPDNVRANALSIAVNQSGAVHVRTVVLLTPEEVDEAIAQNVEYRPPGH